MSTKHIRTGADLVRFGASVRIECRDCGSARTMSGVELGDCYRAMVYADSKADFSESALSDDRIDELIRRVEHRHSTSDRAVTGVAAGSLPKIGHKSVAGMLFDRASVIADDTDHFRKEKGEDADLHVLLSGRFGRSQCKVGNIKKENRCFQSSSATDR